MQDLHELPKLRDSLSYLYVEHAIVERDNHAILLIDKQGKTNVPVANLCVLMLGPGTSITHQAVKVLGENGCSVLWVGEDGTRFYGAGMGETRKAYHLLRQAELACDCEMRTRVVLRMYHKRFGDSLPDHLSLPQIRGLEGVRVRETYKAQAKKHGVEWSGRRYDRHRWNRSDPINRALSAANALLNGLCHAAIVSGGYSPGIGFIHTGKQLSFVYDIADLYKTEITIATAFRIVGESTALVESRVRQACRDIFRETRLLQRILPDIDELLQITDEKDCQVGDIDLDGALPEVLWDALIEEGDNWRWS
jgi:CRISPR-associated protein Cas1